MWVFVVVVVPTGYYGGRLVERGSDLVDDVGGAVDGGVRFGKGGWHVDVGHVVYVVHQDVDLVQNFL